MGIFNDGTLIVKLSAGRMITDDTGRRLEPGREATLALVGHTWVRTLRTFEEGASFNHIARNAGGAPYIEVFPRMFGGELVWATGVEMFVAGRTDIGRLWIWDRHGTLVRVMDIVRRPRAVVEDDVVALREAEWGSTAGAEAVSAWIDRTTPAEHHPVFGGVMIDSEDRVWVAEDTPVEILNRRQRGRRWFVVDNTGSPLMVVTLPTAASMTVVRLADEYALMRTVDDLGVQRVLRFRIEPTESVRSPGEP